MDESEFWRIYQSLINSFLLNTSEFLKDRTNRNRLANVHIISLWETRDLMFPIIFQVSLLRQHLNTISRNYQVP